MKRPIALSALVVSALALSAATALAQKAAPEPATTYWMSAETASGMVAGPAGLSRKLQLQLGSRHRPTGQPSAEHLPPAALQSGATLPLVTPAGSAGTSLSTAAASFDPSTIKGRMLIYWGCGEQGRPGQPLVIDLANAAAGKASALASALSVAAMQPPAAGRHATYGEWPNKTGGAVPALGSLVGDHVVRGNYTPEIRFAIAQDGDFLQPLSPRSAPLPSGAVLVAWPALPNARAYSAGVFASAEDGTVVMWSSSEVKTIGAALPDYLAQDDIARLVQQKALMAPATTECAVPAEVVKAARSPMLQMTAYGPETNFAAPRGAPDAWAVKVRSKATHMAMLGMESARATGGQGAEVSSQAAAPQRPQPQPGRRGLLLKGLGAALGQIR